MDVVYALEEPPVSYRKSIFLAGPTPRSNDVASWRPQALAELDRLGYDGVVYVPEDRSGLYHGDYQAQVHWEEVCLNRADSIVLWVPRDLQTMPALTTNTEFGRWETSGKMVFGAPPAAPKNEYLRHYAVQADAPAHDTLTDTLAAAVAMVGDGALRVAGERDVPLHVWRTDAFARWHASQVAAQNTLMGARVIWSFRVGPRRQIVFMWALHVDVHVAAEDRRKTNEFVLARPDISCVLMYRPAAALDDTEVVLVREFRSPARTADAFIRELPGGSSFKQGKTPTQVAAEECSEETGLILDPARVRAHGSRQLAGTLSAHHGHLFSVELTAEEMQAMRDDDEPHGVIEDSERTYVEVYTVGELRERELTDWSTLGMILTCLAPAASAPTT